MCAIGFFLGALVPSGAATQMAPGEDPSARFEPARTGYRFSFPFDHGSHPSFQTEWWYYTGHLRSEHGLRFGYQLTFFRRRIRPKPIRVPPTRSKWRIDELYFAHLAVTDLQAERFYFLDALSREGLGKAGAEEGRLHVWIDRWSVEAADNDLGEQQLLAQESPARRGAEGDHPTADSLGLNLRVRPVKPIVIHGTQGVSRKGADRNQASHYYSATRMQTAGTLRLSDRTFRVTGESWMDHEFGSGDLSENLVGWDWFSMQLDSGEELMLYRLRRADGRSDPASSGTWVDREGRSRHLTLDDIHVEVLDRWTSPHSGASYPSRWRVSVTPLHAAFEVTPLLADQELRTPRSTGVTYWEGAVRITGTLDAAQTTGRGYVELTGYAERYRPGQRLEPTVSP